MPKPERKYKHIYLKHTAISPIFHSQPPVKDRKSKGNVSTQRTERFLFDTGEKLEAKDLKTVSGNHYRGVSRREFIMNVFDVLGFVKDKYIVDIPYDVAAAIMIGGVMAAGKTKKTICIKNYVSTYTNLPFFGLFGGSYMGAFFPGRLAVGFAYPVIQGTVSLLKYMDSPFTSDFEDIYLPAAEEIRSGAQRYNRMEFNNIEAERGTLEALLKVTSDFPDFEAALTIDDDEEEEEKEENGEDKAKKVVAAAKKYLKTPEAELCLQKLCGYFKVPLHTKTEKKGDTITEITKKIKSLFTVQNIFVVEEAIPAGTRLHSRLSLLPGYGDDELIEITFDAFVETAISKGFIGGMVNRGYGAVITEAKTGTADKPINFSEVSKADKFWGWLEDNREQIRENLLTLDKYLFKKGE